MKSESATRVAFLAQMLSSFGGDDVIPVTREDVPETAESVEGENDDEPMDTSVNTDVTATHAARTPAAATSQHQSAPTYWTTK